MKSILTFKVEKIEFTDGRLGVRLSGYLKNIEGSVISIKSLHSDETVLLESDIMEFTFDNKDGSEDIEILPLKELPINSDETLQYHAKICEEIKSFK